VAEVVRGVVSAAVLHLAVVLHQDTTSVDQPPSRPWRAARCTRVRARDTTAVGQHAIVLVAGMAVAAPPAAVLVLRRLR